MEALQHNEPTPPPITPRPFTEGDLVKNLTIDDAIFSLGKVKLIDAKTGDLFVSVFAGYDTWKSDACALETPAPRRTPPPPNVAEPKRETLDDILKRFKSIEDMLENPDFDGSALVEDMAGIATEAMAAKIDGYEHVVSEFQAFAARMKIRADRYATKARSAANHAARVTDRLLNQMLFYGHEQLPGIDFKAIVKTNPPSLMAVRDPTAEDLLTFGDSYVRENPATYDWNKTPIKKAVLDGSLVSDIFKLEYKKELQFVDRDRPDVTTTAKKPKAKKTKEA